MSRVTKEWLAKNRLGEFTAKRLCDPTDRNRFAKAFAKVREFDASRPSGV